MKLGMMLQDVLLALFRRPATENYPFEKQAAPAQMRGLLHWDPEKCTGCCLCSKDCPSNAIELVTLDKKAKQFVLRYHLDRCTFCSQCVQSCRFNCMQMSSQEWELATTHKQSFTVTYGRDKDIDALLAGFIAADDEPAVET